MSTRFLKIRIAALTVIVVPLGALFWWLELSRTRLQTMLDNKRNDQ